MQAKIKLKRLKKDADYPKSQCAASGCKRKSSVMHGPGTTFPKEYGLVPLCDVHNDTAEAEDQPPKEPEAKEPEGKEQPAALIPGAAVQAELLAEASEAKEVLDMVRKYEIDGQEDYDFANEALGDVKAAWKDLDAKQKKVTKPLNDVLKEVRGWFKPAKDFYSQAEALWKSKILDAHKRAEEEQDKALRAAQEAHQSGDVEAVREAMVRSNVSEIQQASNVTLSKSWDFEIVDAGKIPREYLIPDVKAISGVIKSLGDRANIPGIRVFEKTSVIRRGA